ncbi:ferredoxin-thioredoxin reductase catalytic domain-containing protein [Candidatus Altiarchaeota archaeon]
MGDEGMTPEELVKVWQEFAKDNEFMLNPDKEHVKLICEGLLANETEYGLKLCPCRIRDGSRECDLKLLCPCNFKTHKTWNTRGDCWCGLFIKRK